MVGRGVAEGYLSGEEIARSWRKGLARLPVDGRRVLVLIPDGTRTMPMPLMFEMLERELGPARRRRSIILVALGTHTPMTDAQLSTHFGRTVVDGRAGGHADLQSPLGRPGDVRRRSATIPAHEIARAHAADGSNETCRSR